MVERVDHGVAYEATPQSEFKVADMPEDVQKSVEHVLLKTLRNNGDIHWVSGHDFGEYAGLSERLTGKFEESVPECKDGCLIEVEILAPDGKAENCVVSAFCPKISRTVKKEATEAEKRCLDNHEATKEKFIEHMVTKSDRISTVESNIARYNTKLIDEKQKIDRLV